VRVRRVRSALAAVASLIVLAGGMALMDERVRYAIVHLADGNGPTGELAQAHSNIEETARLIVDVIREQSIEHAPLTVFAIGALALVLFMTRT
jgi:hypothetical protein